MIFAGGVGDWRKLANINDPLPQAMKAVVGENSGWLHMLVWIGLFGLIASFHGIIIGYSRQIFALARAGYLPATFAALSPRFNTPHRALLAGGVVGVAAIFSDEWVQFGGQTLTANIVTMAVLGAIVMYLISMAALFKLRRSEPDLERTYRAPFYPVFPAIALGLGVVCLGAMVWFNGMLTLLFLVLMALAYGYFRLTAGAARGGSARRDASPRRSETSDHALPHHDRFAGLQLRRPEAGHGRREPRALGRLPGGHRRGHRAAAHGGAPRAGRDAAASSS